MEEYDNGLEKRLIISDPYECQAATALVRSLTRMAVSQESAVDDGIFKDLDNITYYLKRCSEQITQMSPQSAFVAISFGPDHAQSIRFAIEKFQQDPELFSRHMTEEEVFVVGLYFAKAPRTAE